MGKLDLDDLFFREWQKIAMISRYGVKSLQNYTSHKGMINAETLLKIS